MSFWKGFEKQASTRFTRELAKRFGSTPKQMSQTVRDMIDIYQDKTTGKSVAKKILADIADQVPPKHRHLLPDSTKYHHDAMVSKMRGFKGLTGFSSAKRKAAR